MDDKKLTGRIRFRVKKKLQIILQVEETWLHTYHAGGSIDSEWVTHWRDARLTDVTV